MLAIESYERHFFRVKCVAASVAVLVEDVGGRRVGGRERSTGVDGGRETLSQRAGAAGAERVDGWLELTRKQRSLEKSGP